MENNLENKAEKSYKSGIFTSGLVEATSSIGIAFVLFALLLTFICRPVQVDGHSMNPTLIDGDWLVISAGFYKPDYEDIVIISREQTNEDPLVKRIIGLPGDEIDIDFEKGYVYRNGKRLSENYIAELTYSQYDVEFPVTVPENCVFVMGDNRNHSSDSRVGHIGMIEFERILGKAEVRLLPWGNFSIYSNEENA